MVVETREQATLQAPIDRVRMRLEETGRVCIEKSNGWINTSCPVEANHKGGDTHHSFGFRELIDDIDEADRRVQLNCFAQCTHQEILAALKLKESDLYSKPNGKGLASFIQHNKQAKQALTLREYSDNKLLPLDFLIMDLGLYDGIFTYHKADGTPYKLKGVAMPYHYPDGARYERIRLRTALSKTGKYSHLVWNEADKEKPLIAHGFQAIREMKKAGYGVIVEGESDWQTLTYHGFPSLGIPGTSNVKTTLDASIIKDIPVLYVIQEQTDQAGQNFPFNVQIHLRDAGYTGEILRVPLKTLTGAKDPSDLHRDLWDKEKPRDHQRFKEAFQKALDQAKLMNYDTATSQSDDNNESAKLYEEIRDKALAIIEKKNCEEKDIEAFYKLAREARRLDTNEQAILEGIIKDKISRHKMLSWQNFKKLMDEAAKIHQAEIFSLEDTAKYGKTAHGMFLNSEKGGIKLSNFGAQIIADIKTDDGAEQIRSYEIEAELAGRHFKFEVLAKDFAKADWVDKDLGARAIVTTGNSMKSHLVNAIKDCSDAQELFHYAHTGWRKIEDGMVYLHAGGCLGQVGQVGQVSVEIKKDLTHLFFSSESAYRANLEKENSKMGQVGQVGQENRRASVKLTGALANYELPCEKENLQQAIKASLRIMDLTKDRITAPLYSAIWRAPLGDIDFAEHLAGKSGWGKSELVALVQQHFGASMNARKLPGSWESTENSLEMLLFQAKDTVVVVDDFKPKGGKVDQDRLQAKADRLFRQIGNNNARGRLDSNLQQRAVRAPRCLVISTGEDVPRGQSLKGRLVALTMEERITTGEAAKKLREAQREARQGLYTQAMTGYIEWLAPRIEAIQTQIQELIEKERDHLVVDGHARSNTNTANLLLGMKCFLQYACEMNAIMPQEAEIYLKRCKAALIEVASDAAHENKQDNPSEQWRQLLVAAIASGHAHLVTPSGDNPGTQYGWVKSVTSMSNSYEQETLRGGGDKIGWIDGDDIYLLSSIAYKVAKAMGSSIGDDITTSELTLRKFLNQDGLLASTDLKKARGTITIRPRQIPGRPDVLHVRKNILFPEDTPSDSSDPLDPFDPQGSRSASEDSSGVGQVSDPEVPGSSEFSDPDLTQSDNDADLLSEYQSLYQQIGKTRKKLAPLDNILWHVPNSGFEEIGQVGIAEYQRRLKEIYASGDSRRLTVGRDEMLRKLGIKNDER